ncbi:MAG: soluble methane monooxygenase-binding protein MmoD [Beijerinckiaceae bacterium]|jgi:soluble methane monooxygenase-binding protein MmoD
MNSRIFWAGKEDETSLSAPAPADANSPDKDFGAAVGGTEIYNQGRYRAFTEDVECMWQWEIHRDDEVVQVGCSLSESSSREAVAHVISFYQRRDLRQIDKNNSGN